jgi:hypothetical protein
MVESKLVELVVAGSNPVGHPIFLKSYFPAAAPLQFASWKIICGESWTEIIFFSFPFYTAAALR